VRGIKLGNKPGPRGERNLPIWRKQPPERGPGEKKRGKRKKARGERKIEQGRWTQMAAIKGKIRSLDTYLERELRKKPKSSKSKIFWGGGALARGVHGSRQKMV